MAPHGRRSNRGRKNCGGHPPKRLTLDFLHASFPAIRRGSSERVTSAPPEMPKLMLRQGTGDATMSRQKTVSTSGLTRRAALGGAAVFAATLPTIRPARAAVE